MRAVSSIGRLLVLTIVSASTASPTPGALAADDEAMPATRFTDVAAEAQARLEHAGTAPIMPLGGGVALGDYDNDELLDIYVTNQGGPNALYRNRGDGTFADVAAAAGVGAGPAVGSGTLFGDYDNDGWRDLYVVNLGPNLLFRNNGDGTFTDVTDTAGVGDDGFGQSATWGDYDNDGHIDLYVVNHHGPNGSADRLYHNEGDGTFADVSDQLSPHVRSAAGFAASFFDYDNDGDVDLYVVNDKAFGEHRANVLWRNDGPGPDGRWHWRDVSTRSRADVALNGMGLAVGDFDNDDDHDLAITNIGANVLLDGDGRGAFIDVSRAAGIERALLADGRKPATWCALSLDADLDGWLDLFLCGSPVEQGDGFPSALFENRGDGTFEDVSGDSGMTANEWSRAGAAGDLDGDGDLDVYVVRFDGPSALYRNNTAVGTADANWLSVRLSGVESNRDGLGAKVRVTTAEGVQMREVQSGGSLGAGSDIAAHFGLGTATSIDRIEIAWPSGIFQTLTDVAANQELRVTEAATSDVDIDVRIELVQPLDPASALIACGADFTPRIRLRNLGARPVTGAEVELTITDVGGRVVTNSMPVGPLAPNDAVELDASAWTPIAGHTYRLDARVIVPGDANTADNEVSAQYTGARLVDRILASDIVDDETGAGVAAGDFDGDGTDDLYLVYHGRPNALWLNNGDGTFRDTTRPANVGDDGWGSGAIAADLDGDGSLDLYVLNLGGNVHYRNRGDGTFDDVTASSGLANGGSSRAALAADFDGDGDTDLFLVNDGQANVLYLNAGDGTFEPAPETAGLTDRGGGRTAAVGDVDGDGEVDIVVGRDGEPNVLYLNNGDATFVAAPGGSVGSTRGRTRAVALADVDGDGTLDLVTANLGQPDELLLNRGDGSFEPVTEFDPGAGPSTALAIFDVDGDGTLDVVIATAGGPPDRVLLNRADTTFESVALEDPTITDTHTVALAVADLDGAGGDDVYAVVDGRPDRLDINAGPHDACRPLEPGGSR